MPARRPPDTLTKIGTQQQAAALAEDHARAFRAVEPRCRRYGSARSRTCCARSTSRPSRCCASARASKPMPASRAAIDTGLAMADLDGTDPAARLAAIEHAVEPRLDRTCGTSSRRLSRNRPTARSSKAMKQVQEPRRQTRWSTSTRMRAIYSAIETLFFGLSLGSVLVLIAIGLAITFGVMGVINMAHGELMMLGRLHDLPRAGRDAAAHRTRRFSSPFRRRSSSPGCRAC